MATKRWSCPGCEPDAGGAEGAPGTLHHDHAHLRVIFRLFQRAAEVAQEFLAQRVRLLRPIECDPRNAVVGTVLLVEHVLEVGHGFHLSFR
jgi:hypothetical protein